jgi:hypothetical protein
VLGAALVGPFWPAVRSDASPSPVPSKSAVPPVFVGPAGWYHARGTSDGLGTWLRSGNAENSESIVVEAKNGIPSLEARVLASAMTRPADLAVRYGGEEFICILPDTAIDGANAVAERIQIAIMALAIPHAGSTVATTLTASFGVVSEICIKEPDAEALLRSVDGCLYQAKLDGRNRIVAVAPT